MADTLVLVNGVPGSGKSTLAVPLAQRLGFPLLGRDVVKESLFDSLGVRDRDWSRELGRAAAGVLWALMPYLPGVVVLDNNVGPQIREMFHAEAHAAGVRRILEIWCDVPLESAVRRHTERAGTSRHPGHQDLLSPQTVEGLTGLNLPLRLGPLLRVRTDRAVDLDAVVDWVQRLLARDLVG